AGAGPLALVRPPDLRRGDRREVADRRWPLEGGVGGGWRLGRARLRAAPIAIAGRAGIVAVVARLVAFVLGWRRHERLERVVDPRLVQPRLLERLAALAVDEGE